MAKQNSILLLTLVHPDFLPPVYAVAKSLMSVGYGVKIICFDSLVPETDQGVRVAALGDYRKSGFLKRRKLDSLFVDTVSDEVRKGIYGAVFSFCPYSFLVARRHSLYHIYMALEVADFTFEGFKRAPFTAIKNLRTIKSLKDADLITTPSVQRSAWLAGRAGLSTLPLTVVNTPYYDVAERRISPPADGLIPELIPGKKRILYTGAVNQTYYILELVEAFVSLEADAYLIITGVGNDAYCQRIKSIAADSAKDIILLPFLPRTHLVFLQQVCDIGVCLFRGNESSIEYQMPAPNKIGEYFGRGLHVVASSIAVGLSISDELVTVVDDMENLALAINTAIAKTNEVSRQTIQRFVIDRYCMQVQLEPVIKALKKVL